MDRFSRTVIGYHGCQKAFADQLLLGDIPIDDWKPSRNQWDWLGNGVYFWEHSPERALRWAREKFGTRGEEPAVIGAIIQLGRCFDLLDESLTVVLGASYRELAKHYSKEGWALPANQGRGLKMRKLDCFVINDCLERLEGRGIEYDTVRGAFLEGSPAFPNAMVLQESHIQVAVRKMTCVLGVFQPNLKS